MKLSRYCFFHRNLIFNAATGAVVTYDEDTCKTIETDLERIADEGVISELIAGGFMIDDRIDEVSRYLYSSEKKRMSPMNHLDITILPTTECNARCFYCFEKGLRFQSMEPSTAEKTIEFIKGHIGGKKELVIHWYGGEPTLELDIMKQITSGLRAYCDENGIHYYAMMYTNGSLLDKAIPCLDELAIKEVQVPIDGYGEIYEKRKAFAHHGCDYDTLVGYCKQMLSLGIRLNVRINLDRNNLQSAKRLIEDLSQQFKDGDYSIYLAQLSTRSQCSVFFTEDEYDTVVKPLYDYLDSLMIGRHKSIRPRLISCYAPSPDSLVIGPDGNLYKCQHCVGDSNQVVGNVSEGVIGNEAYYSWCMFKIPIQCRECKYLPLCGAGCVYEHLVKRSSSGPCNRVKYHLDSKLDSLLKEIEGINDA